MSGRPVQNKESKGLSHWGDLWSSPSENFAKLKNDWHIFHDFQPISSMHRLHLNSNASFTLSKT